MVDFDKVSPTVLRGAVIFAGGGGVKWPPSQITIYLTMLRSAMALQIRHRHGEWVLVGVCMEGHSTWDADAFMEGRQVCLWESIMKGVGAGK